MYSRTESARKYSKNETGAPTHKDGISKQQEGPSLLQALSSLQRMMLKPIAITSATESTVECQKVAIQKSVKIQSLVPHSSETSEKSMHSAKAVTEQELSTTVQQSITTTTSDPSVPKPPTLPKIALFTAKGANAQKYANHSPQQNCANAPQHMSATLKTITETKIFIQRTTYIEKVSVQKNANKNGAFEEVQRVVEWSVPERYQVRQLIGSGSYGHVCEAYDTVLKRIVAIKKVHPVFEDLIDCKRILREIAILNRLNHKNVVKILDLIVPSDLQNFEEIYVVLEIADSDFKKLVKSNIHLTQTHVTTLLYNLLVGIRYIHSAGIFHRDLKPANCLVNQDCSVQICDFGLARTVNSLDKLSPDFPKKKEDDKLLDMSGTRNLKRQLTGHVVTRWYRAPELILLQESYTEAIDVWSIGCILGELLGMLNFNSRPSERSPLFPGSSCFPLSPEQKHSADNASKMCDSLYSRENRDQLNMIFNVIGTPSVKDIAAIERSTARKYLEHFQPRNGVNLAQRFPHASPDAIDLLKRMLVFNPQKRITVAGAIAHKLFDQLRPTTLEMKVQEKIRLPFDDWGNMDEPQLRYAFLKEIQFHHTDIKIPTESPFVALPAKEK